MDAVHVAQLIGSGVVVAAGMLLMAGGAIGLLRFPDLYSRLHAAQVSDGAGAVVLVIGLAIAAPNWEIAARLLALAALIGALGPTLTHLVAQSAHAAGLSPITGRYAAPRPGGTRAGDGA